MSLYPAIIINSGFSYSIYLNESLRRRIQVCLHRSPKVNISLTLVDLVGDLGLTLLCLETSVTMWQVLSESIILLFIILELIPMLLVANLTSTKKHLKMTETLAHGYSSESTQRELSNECQHDRVNMVFNTLCALVLWRKVASALQGVRWNVRRCSLG